jgi:hypothetical protein
MRTFRPSGSQAFLMSQAREVAESLAKSMAKKSLAGKNLAIYLKTDEFKMFTRSTMLNRFPPPLPTRPQTQNAKRPV